LGLPGYQVELERKGKQVSLPNRRESIIKGKKRSKLSGIIRTSNGKVTRMHLQKNLQEENAYTR